MAESTTSSGGEVYSAVSGAGAACESEFGIATLRNLAEA